MISKILVLAFILAIFVALGAGLVFLIGDRRDSTRTVKALTMRIVLTIALLIFLVLAYFMGWIVPHGIYPH